MSTTLTLLISMAAALLATRLPFINDYLAISFRLLHDTFHSLITNRKKEPQHPFKTDVLAYLSYTITTVFTIGLFYFASTHQYQLIFYTFSGLLIASLLLWIRRILDFLWAASFIALMALPYYYNFTIALMPMTIFVTSFLLIQLIIHAFQVCKVSFRVGTGLMGKIKWVPSMILAIGLLLQSLIASYFVLAAFIFSGSLPWINLPSFQNLPWI